MANYFDSVSDPQASAPAAGDQAQSNYFDSFHDPNEQPFAGVKYPSTGQYYPQMEGAGRLPAMTGSNLASGLAQGVGLPGTLSDLFSRAMDKYVSPYTLDPLTKMVFGQSAPTGAELREKGFAYDNPLSGANLESGLTKLGIANRPDLQPQSTGETLLSAGSRGLGSAVPTALLGPAAAMPGLLAGGAGGGIGGHYGGELGDKIGHPVLGTVLGSLLAGGGGTALGNAATRGGNAALGNLGELGQTYKTAGVPLNFTGFDKPAAYGSQAIGSAGRVHSLAQQELDAFGNSVEGTASQLGNSTSLQELGVNAQAAGQNWLQTFKNNSNVAHEAVSQIVGPQTPVDLSSTRKIITDLTSKAGGSPEAESFIKSGLAKSIEGIAGNQGAALPWETVRAIRTRVGEYLENPQLVADAGTAQAKRLYSGLTEDLRIGAAKSPNPNAVKLFDMANAYTKQGHDFIDSALGPILNKDAPGAASYILGSANRGDTVLSPLRQEIPEIANEAAAFKLRDMASATAGRQGAAGSTVSPSGFLTDWNRLSPEAKSALYADPQVAAKVDALAKVSESVKQRMALLNTSNTAHHGALTGMGIMGAEGAMKGFETGGMPGAVGGALMGGAAIPAFNYGISLLGANRPLARLMAAQGAPSYVAPSLLSAGNASVPNLLTGRP